MNIEDIIKFAREADREWDCDRDMVEWLEWFAALIASRVAAEEREACAEICDTYDAMLWDDEGEHMTGLGDKIRNRKD